MKVRMKVALGGSWPAVGGEVDVQDWRAEGLIANGWAEPTDAPDDDPALPDDDDDEGVPDG